MHEFPKLDLFGVKGFEVDIASVLAILVSCIIVFVIARLAVRNLSVDRPSKMQNFMEWVVEFVQNLIGSTMDLKRGRAYLSLGMTLIMFIFVSNMLGLPFTIVTDVHEPLPALGISEAAYNEAHEAGKHLALAWWKSPTADLSVTAALALTVIVIVHYLGLTRNTKHYIKHYFEPFWFFFPINILEQIAKPLTLALRLFANIFAGEVLISTILMLNVVSIPLLVAWQGFSIFVGAIQAFLFTILTMVYIAQASVHEEDSAH